MKSTLRALVPSVLLLAMSVSLTGCHLPIRKQVGALVKVTGGYDGAAGNDQIYFLAWGMRDRYRGLSALQLPHD